MTRWAANLIYVVALLLFKIAFRYRIEGRENLELPDGGTAILAGNHMSMIDPLFLIFATRNNVRFVAKEELFAPGASRFVAQGIARMGVFPIKRDSADRVAIRRCVAALKRGEFVGIYPQGTRVMPGEGDDQPVHEGVVLIANMAHVPIIPVGITGTEKVRPKGQKLLHFPKVIARIGKPVDPHAFDALPKRERASACAAEVMRQCFSLRDGIDPGPPRIPGPEPGPGPVIGDPVAVNGSARSDEPIGGEAES